MKCHRVYRQTVSWYIQGTIQSAAISCLPHSHLLNSLNSFQLSGAPGSNSPHRLVKHYAMVTHQILPTFCNITSPLHQCTHHLLSYFRLYDTTLSFGSLAFCVSAPRLRSMVIMRKISPQICLNPVDVNSEVCDSTK